MTYVRTRPATYVHEWACVYTIHVVHPYTGVHERFGYIGQSAGVHRRDPDTGLPLPRLYEHLDEKWWAWSVVEPYVEVLWSGSCTQAQLDRMERTAIRNHRPLYNIEYNMSNGRRIPPWEAEEAARARGYVPPKAISYSSSSSMRSSNGRVTISTPGDLFKATFFVTVGLLLLVACLISMCS